MKFVNRKVLVLAAVTAVAGSAMATPTFASAKTYKMTCKAKGDNPGSLTNIAADISCPKPFGKGRQTGTLKIPIQKGVWKFKGCTMKNATDTRYTAKINGPNVSGGVIKFSGGKGKKCKGAKGSAKVSGSLATSTFTYKVTLKF